MPAASVRRCQPRCGARRDRRAVPRCRAAATILRSRVAQRGARRCRSDRAGRGPPDHRMGGSHWATGSSPQQRSANIWTDVVRLSATVARLRPVPGPPAHVARPGPGRQSGTRQSPSTGRRRPPNPSTAVAPGRAKPDSRSAPRPAATVRAARCGPHPGALRPPVCAWPSAPAPVARWAVRLPPRGRAVCPRCFQRGQPGRGAAALPAAAEYRQGDQIVEGLRVGGRGVDDRRVGQDAPRCDVAALGDFVAHGPQFTNRRQAALVAHPVDTGRASPAVPAGRWWGLADASADNRILLRPNRFCLVQPAPLRSPRAAR